MPNPLLDTARSYQTKGGEIGGAGRFGWRYHIIKQLRPGTNDTSKEDFPIDAIGAEEFLYKFYTADITMMNRGVYHALHIVRKSYTLKGEIVLIDLRDDVIFFVHGKRFSAHTVSFSEIEKISPDKPLHDMSIDSKVNKLNDLSKIFS